MSERISPKNITNSALSAPNDAPHIVRRTGFFLPFCPLAKGELFYAPSDVKRRKRFAFG